MMRNVFQRKTGYRTLFKDEPWYQGDPRETVRNNKSNYQLSTFVELEYIIPIFYEESYNSNGNRYYFCFYYDRTDNNFHVLRYITDSITESGYGVNLQKLKDSTKIIKTGKDFLNLKNETNTPFYDISFFYENLEAMYQFFGNKKIRKTLSPIYHILNRMVTVPVYLTDSSGIFHPVFTGDSLFKSIESKDSEGLVSHTFSVPILPKIKTATDVLGNYSTYNYGGIHSTKITIYNNKLVGFRNLNFLETSKTLVKQYKLSHKIQDWLKDLF